MYIVIPEGELVHPPGVLTIQEARKEAEDLLIDGVEKVVIFQSVEDVFVERTIRVVPT